MIFQTFEITDFLYEIIKKSSSKDLNIFKLVHFVNYTLNLALIILISFRTMKNILNPRKKIMYSNLLKTFPKYIKNPIRRT